MTSAQDQSQQASGAGAASSSRAASSRSWIPPIPSALQRLFDSVPLVTYPPNELPYRSSPASYTGDLPTLHVFTTEEDAARGKPSYNPSCLKWQAYLRFTGVQHAVVSSTNHASPTGSLPFLQPALLSSPEHRLDPRLLLPVASSRLDSYARQHGSVQSFSSSDDANTSTPSQTPDQRHRRQQAYQALLDNPIRAAWLYALYLSLSNEKVLRHLYVDRVSRSGAVRATTLQQLRAAARAQVAHGVGGEAASVSFAERGWAMTGSPVDLLTWAMGGRAAVDGHRIYEEARRALAALEALLGEGGGDWFFEGQRPSLFDASVFSYTYLILSDEYKPAVPWGDDKLRRMVRDECPLLVAHERRILENFW